MEIALLLQVSLEEAQNSTGGTRDSFEFVAGTEISHRNMHQLQASKTDTLPPRQLQILKANKIISYNV